LFNFLINRKQGETMKALITGLVLGLASMTSLAHDGGAVSMAKIAELSVHRVDRLVALNKIDAGYWNRIESIEVAHVSGPGKADYRSVISQTAPAGSAALQIELLFDHDGIPLSFKIMNGGVAGMDPQWPGVDAGTLSESGMHYLLDNSTVAKLAPYFNSLATVLLTKANLAGQPVAVLVLTATSQAQKLNVFIKLDGTVISTELAP
jgi:hypothetical protein